jgi:CheY-like chemotaxis protein
LRQGPARPLGEHRFWSGAGRAMLGVRDKTDERKKTMADDSAIECPQCGHKGVPSEKGWGTLCAHCGIDLKWALERGSRYWTEGSASRSPLILLSEDEPAMLQLLGLILQQAGYRVARALDAFVTLELAGRLQPDLIITDFMKPGMRGDEMISRLRSDPALCDIPVIVLSAGATDERVRMAMEAGVTRYLFKPIAPNALLAAVEAVLGG